MADAIAILRKNSIFSMVQKYLSNILLSDYNADFLAPKLDVISKVVSKQK